MKRLIITVITALTVLTMNAIDSMPAGRLTDLRFRVSGGMMPFDQEYLDLRTDADGVSRLTVNGTSPGETITFEVADSVFARCRDIIERTGLYRATGFYQSDIVIFDAPSQTFSATITDQATGKRASISASGFYPREIADGIKAVCGYLHSLAGDRKAPGHLDDVNADSLPRDMTFADGDIAFSRDGDIEALCRRYCDAYGLGEYHAASWRTRFMTDNDGGIYMAVSNSGRDFHAVLPCRDIAPVHPILPLMQGSYTDGGGRRWLISRDGKLTHGDGEDGTRLNFLLPESGNNDVLVEIGDATYRVMLTDDGLNLYRRHVNSGRPRTVTYDEQPLRLTMDVSAGNEAGIPGRWHVAALYPLPLSTLALLPRDIVGILSSEADARATSTFRDAEQSAYFHSKSWYKPDSLERFNFPVSDTERANQYSCRIFYGPNSKGPHPYE